jgi:hypothetical protein
MADLTAMLQAAAGAGEEETDPNFNQTVLLLHGDGTNGAQNNTFLDSSTNTFTITRNGNTTQGTFSPFSLPNGEFSVNFKRASNDDRLLAASSAGLGLASANFCIELWAYFASAITGDAPFATNITSGGFIADTFYFGPHSVNSGKVTVYIYNQSAGSAFIAESTNPPVNEWVHYAFVRDGNDFDIYRNGTSTASSTFAGAVTGASSSLFIGRSGDGVSVFDGYLSNLRVVNGSPVYTAAFTPPTTPLTNITNTTLLTLQSNRFVDNSSSPITITVNAGTPSVQPFSPFLPSAAYSTSVNGGSGYFDGSGDYLEQVNTASSALDVSSGDWTVQVWIYPTAPGNDYATVFSLGTTVDSQTNAWSLHMNSNYQMFILISGSGGSINASANTAVGPFAWNHVALSRASGTTTMYVNGVSVGTTATAMPSTQYASIGGYSFYTDKNTFPGYISGVQLLKGTSINFASVGVPTAPPTAIANTSLLCNFTNAGIFDNTGKNNLETVADAQIDTSVKKYGTGSMEFDGTGDWLIMKDTPEMVFGTGDFTIEFWVNTNQTVNEFAVVDFRTVNGFFPFIAHDSTRGVFYYLNSDYRIESNTVLTTGIWYHIAVARSGSSTKLFINGTQAGSTYTNSNSLSVGANRPAIGINGESLGTLPLNGYIDDLRITKGVARYTAAFTPPTAAFPNLIRTNHANLQRRASRPLQNNLL